MCNCKGEVICYDCLSFEWTKDARLLKQSLLNQLIDEKSKNRVENIKKLKDTIDTLKLLCDPEIRDRK